MKKYVTPEISTVILSKEDIMELSDTYIQVAGLFGNFGGEGNA